MREYNEGNIWTISREEYFVWYIQPKNDINEDDCLVNVKPPNLSENELMRKMYTEEIYMKCDDL